MSVCLRYNPDNVFYRFKLVEFPISYVGLATTQFLDVDINISKSAYLKTMCEGRLLKFKEAYDISASHRAFDVEQVDDRTIKIKFLPKNECITRAKRKRQIGNRFVFDLRLIQVDETRCCNNELHAEVGRFYISGQYEYCQITHSPKIIDFGDVVINTKVVKYVRIRNESNLIAARMHYEKLNSFDVSPSKFTLQPNSSIRLTISIRPTNLKVPPNLLFKIRNPRYEFDDLSDTSDEDETCITYILKSKINVSYTRISKQIVVESLHKLCDQLPKYTYMNEELEIHNERKSTAMKHLKDPKYIRAKKPTIEKFTTGRDICYSDPALRVKKPIDGNFCKIVEQKASTYDLFDIQFFPFLVDFGRVSITTYGEQELTISNKTKFKISLRLCPDERIVYTANKLSSILLKLEPMTKSKVTVCCPGFVVGTHEGTFEYLVDNTYKLKHMYSLVVSNPTLMVMEKNLKFGMVTTESFVTSVPVRIYNNFNNTANFEWTEIHPDIPFEIIPMSGSVPGQSCKICDVIYVCKPTKTKTHELDLISKSISTKVIPIELSIVTRKLSIKFLQPAVVFKDIPLNLETIERVKLENSSREIALFYVVEPLIPGLKIEPMCGTIRPKMIMTFDIIVKIPCVLEFSFDIYVKINNKEVVVLPISGAVAEPKVMIQPRNIYMPRIPCHMITYVPVTFQNLSTLKTEVEVLDTGDDNIFDVYIAQGNDKQRVFEFTVEGGQSKTVFIKVCDIFRREYEMYIPFKINGLLGPPDEKEALSTELQYYIGDFEQSYENNPKVKVKSVNKDICYCRIVGVITVPWLMFSVDKFEFDYKPHTSNTIEFTISNISKYYLYVTILCLKLAPNFSLDLRTEDHQSIINEANIKFELDRGQEAAFSVQFHPKGHGKFVATATLFLDKHLTIPYSNLTFFGKRVSPAMTPSAYRVVFPACNVGTTITRTITIDYEAESNLDLFSCACKEIPQLSIKFVDYEVKGENCDIHTIVTVQLTIFSQTPCKGNVLLNFIHGLESFCDVEVEYCITHCPLTLHANLFVSPEDNPYPYYPSDTNTELYEYLEKCSAFLEKWMFQQGFRRDLYPVIPDTFHAISSAVSSQAGAKSGKGINVSYLNFVRRIAGPLMKHVRKVSAQGVDETFKCVKEIHDTYREIIKLLQSRGANLWALHPKYLLSHEQFIIYADNVTPKCNADIVLTRELLIDPDLYNRLNKQSWIDFILQSYKVFIMDSCFFECVCVNTEPRHIVNILVEWYNEQISVQYPILLGKNKQTKLITNITTDLSDGVALASVISYYCPFLRHHFSIFTEVHDENEEGDIINNACLIIEAMNQLRLYFPLSSKDFLEPNFLQMLFLSIHLYVVLPMFKPKDTIILNPPLLRSSTRHVSICPTSQESLIFSYMILNNNRNAFVVEKVASADNGKKMFLSVKYIANFVDDEECLLLVHGYNKTRIFDTYIMFILHGQISTLYPERKCKVTGPLYRPNKVDIMVASPFQTSAIFNIYITDIEPTVPVHFEEINKPRFYVRRLNLIDKEIYLYGMPKEAGQQDLQEHKLYLQLICLSTQVGNSWIWFKSEFGQFFIRVTTQPRWDLPLDTLQSKVHTWPMDPCSCGEACECYRTTAVLIPYRNELMLKALRYALVENASSAMIQIFDQLIETTTGKIILCMLLEEGGTNMSELEHLLRNETTYRITSRALLPRIDRVTLAQHTNGLFSLPVTIPADDKLEKYSITLTSDCGMDIRTYRIFFIESKETVCIKRDASASKTKS
ncbi:cilia- and flagella-associated protein 47-like [Anticarsia gemmatalis]|uniref:cilia- and flagella-associated protein 47-like n=1 Tax=Anticarsia gemmatalis TaxID=129554 RepID=UPI003F7691C3